VVHTLPTGEQVCGVTSLDNHLYVLRDLDQIEIYDVDSYSLLRCLTVHGLGYAYDIVACGHNRCAYIPDCSGHSVHRVALSDDTVTQWPVTDIPAGLSLTVTHGVLVTCPTVRKIKEFSTDGQLLRELTLPEDVVSPWHSIKLSSGEFIVCHCVHDPLGLHRVCLIGSHGGVVDSHGGLAGSGSQKLHLPAHMAVDRNGFVFVVNLKTGRVLQLSPALTYVRGVAERECDDQVMWVPRDDDDQSMMTFRIHLDVDRRLLYIAENGFRYGRVVVVGV